MSCSNIRCRISWEFINDRETRSKKARTSQYAKKRPTVTNLNSVFSIIFLRLLSQRFGEQRLAFCHGFPSNPDNAFDPALWILISPQDRCLTHPLPSTTAFSPSLQIVQYIELFNRADLGASTGDDDSFYYFSEVYPTSSSTVGYDQDVSDGHGTHTAGTAAGAQIFDVTASCSADEMLGCVGECVTAEDAADDSTNGVFNIDTYCPYFDCDGNGQTSPNCLSDNVTQNLNDGGGIARGAKLAIFDVRHNGDSMATLAGNGLFNVTSDTGAKLHSNSWGYVDSWCDYSELDLQFDTFMYEVSHGIGAMYMYLEV